MKYYRKLFALLMAACLSAAMALPAFAAEEICPHTNYEAHEYAAPTCTAPGKLSYLKCKDCDKYQYGESTEWVTLENESVLDVPAHTGDMIESHTAKAPTCSAAGNVQYRKCTTCGKYLVGSETEWKELTEEQISALTLAVNPTAHAVVDVAVKEADCSGGVKEAHKLCSICRKVSTDNGTTWVVLNDTLKAQLYLPSVHPNAVSHTAVASPNCHTAGNIAYSSCPGCGFVSFEGSGTAFDPWVSPSSEGGMNYVVYNTTVHDYSNPTTAVGDGNGHHSIPCAGSTTAAPHPSSNSVVCTDANADNRCDVCGTTMPSNSGTTPTTPPTTPTTTPTTPTTTPTTPAAGDFGDYHYAALEGASQSWVNTSSTNLRFRSAAAFSAFKEVQVDGQVIASQNYSVWEGSTYVELKNAYLKTLAVGKHTLRIVSTDGSMLTDFTIKQGAPVPKTGDESNLAAWIAVVAGAAVIGSAVLVLDKKRIR